MGISTVNISGPTNRKVYGDDYYLTVSGEIKKKSDTFAGHRKKAAEKRDRYVPESPPNTSPSITNSLIRGWAKKYDAGNMTQAEYQAFLDDLVSAGVIQEADKIHLGYYPDLIVLDPDAPACHEVREYDPFEHYLNMEQAGGNALDWAKFWKNYYDDGIGYTSEHVSRQQSLFDKISSILDRMAEVE